MAQAHSPTKPTRARRSVRHFRWLAAAAGVGLAVAGCPPSLEDPERFTADCPDDFSAEALMRSRCSGAGCHGGDDELGANLDLVSAGVTERLVGVPSADCDGMLISGAGTSESVFVQKLNGTQQCGGRMPLGGELSDREIACMSRWVADLIAAGVPDAAPAADAAGDAAGDATQDSSTDATTDRELDAPKDGAVDSISDAASDADASSDASDAGTDT